MAWHHPGDKPLSEPMMVRLPTHICVTRPQWVNSWWYINGSAQGYTICIAIMLEIIVTDLHHWAMDMYMIYHFSCLRPSVCVTVWWHWDPQVLERPVALMCWWKPWQTVASPIGRWEWTQSPSQRRRCLVDWMWLPMIGRMAFSPPCGGGRSRKRKVGTIGLPIKQNKQYSKKSEQNFLENFRHLHQTSNKRLT